MEGEGMAVNPEGEANAVGKKAGLEANPDGEAKKVGRSAVDSRMEGVVDGFDARSES